MLALYDIIRLGQMNPVGPVHALKSWQMLVDFKDYRPGVFKDGSPGVVGNTQTAKALVIWPGNGNKRRIHPDMTAVKLRKLAQNHRHKAAQATALELALVVSDVPTVIGEGGLLGILLNHLNAGANHQTAPDFHIPQFALPCRQRAVHQLGKACAESIVHPVSRLHRPGGSPLGAYKFMFIIFHGCFRSHLQKFTLDAQYPTSIHGPYGNVRLI